MKLPPLLLIAALIPAAAAGQAVSQRGSIEARLQLFPQEAPGDARRAVAEVLFRQEAAWRPAPSLTVAGAFDARADQADRTERAWALDFDDRGARRPNLSVRRLSAALRRGGLTVEAGKQLIRWGRADVLNPTDRFAPRDFMDVVDSEFLPVTGARATYERGSETVDLVVARFTPSRLPLPGSRWSDRRLTDLSIPVRDGGGLFPSRMQVGGRWSHVGGAAEFAASFFDGFNHLPRLDARLDAPAGAVVVTRDYVPLRMYGADAAIPLRWVTLKGEVGYFTSRSAAADEYGAFVIQAERQRGEWFLVGGYAGEVVRRRGGGGESSPERGLAHTFLGRASCAIDVNRAIAVEGAVRQSGEGAYLEAEYSQAVGAHLRLIARGTLVRGAPDDFLGQFRHNSNAQVTLRYGY